MDKKIQDICNGEINLGSTLKDILGVLQGEWCDTEKNEWELIKLGSKFSIVTISHLKRILWLMKSKNVFQSKEKM